MSNNSSSAFSVLRRFVRKRAPQECCELCSAELGPEHSHLVRLDNRQLLCCCEGCAILFAGHQAGKFRRVPRRIQVLTDFHLTDELWETFRVPINLVFFFYSTAARRVTALYPSPAGPMESLLTLEAWDGLTAQNPILRELEPDVEALLVNRVRDKRDYFRAPIDECYKLVGLIRSRWRGLSGGSEVWQQIAQFFGELERRAKEWRT